MKNLEPDSILHERYQILKPLGKGGMGNVYLAEDQSLNKRVAIKENFNLGEESASQFLQEAHLLADLHHPNLPRVTDYFIEGINQYLVMDYLPGDDLQILLEREGRQSVSTILPWADQLADALQYMHTRKPPVTHRDIKPANIKLRSDGTAVLVDFGIAKAAETSQQTAVGAMGFTPGFAPPEQTGGGRTGPHSDQYAFAATLYMLLTGNRPVESVKRVLNGEKTLPARDLNPMIPVNISDALQKAMSINPQGRFKSMKDMVRALHDPSFRWQEPTPETARKPRPLVFLLAVILITTLALIILGVSVFGLDALPAFFTSDRHTSTAFPDQRTEIRQSTANIRGTATEKEPTIDSVMPFTETPAPEPTRSLISDGNWLAFSSNQADGKTMQIWLMQVGLNTEGNPVALSIRQLTSGSGDKTHPAWSQDGDFLLYSAPAASGLDADGLDIWRIAVDGGKPVDLTNRKGDDLFASWSPDGNLISFTNDGRDDGVRQLYSMDTAGRDQTRISTAYEESQAIWTPDMKTLLYVITARGNNYLYQRSSDSNYQTPQPYDVTEVFGRFGQVTDPAISPDGSQLAYTRTKGRSHWIGVADFLSRGGSFSLVTRSGMDFDPAWSSDGKWIAFTSERDGLSHIYIMTSTGLVQTCVSPVTASESYPAWQP